MDAFYINLDTASLRQKTIEASFNLAARPGWQLRRFPAVAVTEPSYDGPRLRHVGTGRRLSIGEEGCYLSHRTLIDSPDRGDKPFMVLEDDAVFAPPSVNLIDGFMNSGQAAEWDLIFTDVIIPDPTGMINLFRLKQTLQFGQIQILNLYNRPFAGASAYIVMPRGVKILRQHLNDPTLESIPYDMAIRSLIYGRQVKACVLFPFPTTVGDTARASQIQDTSTSTADLLWNTFRQMIWIGASKEATQKVLQEIQGLIDSPARDLGVVLTAMASKTYVTK